MELWTNVSLQKKVHSEMKSLEIPGFENLQNGAQNKLFFSMNLMSILVLENEHIDGDPKVALFRIQYTFKITATSVFFLP